LRCADVVIDLSRKITQFALEFMVNGWAEALVLCYSRFMFGDNAESVHRVGENASGMMKLSSEMVEVLLMRKVDLEVLIWVWYCNLLILQIATASTAVRVRTA
jgi:hypothetical protein